MTDARNPRLNGILDALQTLREAVEEDSDNDWPTRAFHGWIDKIGQNLDDDLSHLKLEDDPVVGSYLLTYIDMAIAYLEPLVETTHKAK